VDECEPLTTGVTAADVAAAKVTQAAATLVEFTADTQAGAYTRPLFGSTIAIPVTKYTLDNPY